MSRPRRPAPPLDQAALERLALHYVGRYATTRAKLTRYLDRKLFERGSDGAVDPQRIAEHMADLRYIDDHAFAEARASAMSRRGLGARRVSQALLHDGIDVPDREALLEEVKAQSVETALAFARRRRIGPWAVQTPDPKTRDRWIASMLRAGHGFALARSIVDIEPGGDYAFLYLDDR